MINDLVLILKHCRKSWYILNASKNIASTTMKNSETKQFGKFSVDLIDFEGLKMLEDLVRCLIKIEVLIKITRV